MNRTDFGKKVFQEFNFRHWIEIRKGPSILCVFHYGRKEKHPSSLKVLR